MVLETLERQTLDRMAAKGHLREYPAGQIIYRRGETGTSLLIVRSGQAEVSVTTSLGKKSILGVIGPGGIVGDIACLDGGARSADVQALEPLDVCMIDRPVVLNALRDDPESAMRVIQALCLKARNATEMFEVLSMTNSKSRLAACVLRLTSTEDDTLNEIKLSQSWLGAYAGLTRENVNRHLRAWGRDQIVRFEDGVLHLLDRDKLQDIAQSDDSLRLPKTL